MRETSPDSATAPAAAPDATGACDAPRARSSSRRGTRRRRRTGKLTVRTMIVGADCAGGSIGKEAPVPEAAAPGEASVTRYDRGAGAAGESECRYYGREGDGGAAERHVHGRTGKRAFGARSPRRQDAQALHPRTAGGSGGGRAVAVRSNARPHHVPAPVAAGAVKHFWA